MNLLFFVCLIWSNYLTVFMVSKSDCLISSWDKYWNLLLIRTCSKHWSVILHGVSIVNFFRLMQSDRIRISRDSGQASDINNSSSSKNGTNWDFSSLLNLLCWFWLKISASKISSSVLELSWSTNVQPLNFKIRNLEQFILIFKTAFSVRFSIWWRSNLIRLCPTKQIIIVMKSVCFSHINTYISEKDW